MNKKILTRLRSIARSEWRQKKPESLFVVICLFFGSFFILTTPSLWGIDEIEHFFRAYQVSSLDFGVHKIDETGYGGRVPHDLNRLSQYAKGDLVDNHPDNANIWERNDYDLSLPYDQLKSHSIRGARESVIYSNTAAYSPVGYIPSSIGIGISRVLNLNIGNSITLARFFNLIAYTGIVYIAIWAVRRKDAWVIFVIALLPMMVFQASIVSNDTIINSFALLLFALLLRSYRLYKNKELLNTKLIVLIGISLFAIACSKPNYVFLLPIFLLLPQRLFKSKSDGIKIKFIWAAIVLIPVAAWALVSSPVSDAIRMFRGSGVAQTINVKEQTSLVLSHPLGFIAAIIRSLVMYGSTMTQNVIGILGWNYVYVPVLGVAYAYFLILIAALNAKNMDVTIRKMLIIVGSLFCVVLSIFFILYVTFNSIGEKSIMGIQGRYFLPLLPFTVYIIARFLPISVSIKQKIEAPFFAISSIGLLLISAIYYTISTY